MKLSFCKRSIAVALILITAAASVLSVSAAERMDFSFRLTDTELRDLAWAYYADVHRGAPQYAEVVSSNEREVRLRVGYAVAGESRDETYVVDRHTGRGKDQKGKEFNLYGYYGFHFSFDANSAFLKILQEKEEEILACRHQTAPVAFADVLGDETRELFFVTYRDRSTETGVWIEEILHIYTFNGFFAQCVYSEPIEKMIGGGESYCVFRAGDHDLWIMDDWINDSRNTTFTQYGYDEARGALVPRRTYRRLSVPDYENVVNGHLSDRETFERDGAAISEREYETAIADLDRTVRDRILQNDSSPFEQDHPLISMNYREALRVLGVNHIYRDGKTVTVLNRDFEDYVFARPSMDPEPDLDLAFVLCALSFSAYDQEDIGKSFKSLGFSSVYVSKEEYVVSGEHKAAFALAKKETEDGRTLVCVAVRGSSDGGDWRTNFGPGAWTTLMNGKHEGFMISVENIVDHLKSFVGKDLSSDGITYVITGHSLGAGVSNLLAVELSDPEIHVKKENVYAYTFGTPDVAKKWPLDFNDNGIHNNIKNICNALDVVTQVPGVLLYDLAGVVPGSALFQWGKFGVTKWFSAAPEHEIDWSGYPDPISALQWPVAYIADGVAIRHMEATYLAGLAYGQVQFGSEEEIRDVPDRVLIVIKCPVNVFLYDGEERIAEIRDGVVTVADPAADTVFAAIDGDRKLFSVPIDHATSVRIVATDSGKMTVSLQTVRPITYEAGEKSVWSAVELEPDREFLCELGENRSAELSAVVLDENGASSRIKIPKDTPSVSPGGAGEGSTETETGEKGRFSPALAVTLSVFGAIVLTLLILASVMIVKSRRKRS